MFKNKYIIIGLVIVLLLVVGLSSCRSNKKATPTNTDNNSTATKSSDQSDDDFEQSRLVKRYGEAPKGFIWKDDGSLLALGDKSLTSEEVAYNYLKAASTLDFDLLQKSSNNSQVIKSYEGYYDDQDYKIAFTRKMYKDVLKSMVVDKIEDTALFADTKCIYTFSVDALDLSDKDFWKADKDTIFKNLYAYYRDEDDTTKGKQYIYDYIIKWYESDKAPKKKVKVELVLTKNKDGAWLVTGDTDLDTLCKYTDGEKVNEYIYNCYKDWYDDTYDK